MNIWLLVPRLWAPKTVQKQSVKPWLKPQRLDTDPLVFTWSGHTAGSSDSACLSPEPATPCFRPSPSERRSHGWAGWTLVGTKVSLRVSSVRETSFPCRDIWVPPFPVLTQNWGLNPSNLHKNIRWEGSAFLSSGTSPEQEGTSSKASEPKNSWPAVARTHSSPWNKHTHGHQRLKLQQPILKKKKRKISSLSGLLNW